MIKTLKDFWLLIGDVIRSPYRWLFVFYVLWLYRVDFIPDTGSGTGKLIQVITIFGIVYLIRKENPRFLQSCNNTNNVIKSFLILYLFATASALWSIMPSFSFFLAFQNVILLFGFVWFFSNFTTFVSLERAFLSFTMMTILFEAIVLRITYQPFLFVHYLPAGSSAALCISYCVGEWLTMRKNDYERKTLLKSCIFLSAIVLVTSTSSGANASAIFGIAVASLFSGKAWLGLLLLSVAVFLFLYRDIAESLIFLIMPGKTEAELTTATGRQTLWEIMLRLAEKKPWFGYGFGCIERAATLTGKIKSPDAHNNYIGFYGSLGYVGGFIACLHFCFFLLFTYVRRKSIGFVGILSALSCALMNGYSFGFLSGKACSITVVYIELVVLTFYYSQINSYNVDEPEQ